jgi:GNAT superfamily N-acetyltransferase
VRPVARGRGIGERLLRTALHWTFADRRLPQAALCVTEWRQDARRLYERAGFRQSATGRGARLLLP